MTAAGILRLRPDRMRRLGLSAAKTLYIRELAKHTRRGSVVFESLRELDDVAVIEHLTQVKGIGVWTAQMFLMFALRRNDVLPVGDLGIRMAMKSAYGLEDLPEARRNGNDRGGMETVYFRGVLVSLAQPGCGARCARPEEKAAR